MAIDPKSTVDCSGLDGFKAFKDYASLLRNRTSFNETLLSQCQLPVCQALWGFGEPDLSGIGAAVGYMLSFFLGTIVLPLLSVLSSHFRSSSRSVVGAGMSSFFESAAYFALAIQVATIATLAPRDLETKTTSFGDYEATIAGVVSALCLLPPIPPLVLLCSAAAPSIRGRQSYRLIIFAITVAPSIYPFLEQCIRNWGPSSIGEHQGDGGKTYVTDDEWAAINSLCFGSGGVEHATEKENQILSIFQMAGSLFVFLFAVTFSIPAILQQVGHVYGEENLLQQKVGGWVDRAARICRLRFVRVAVLILPFFLAVPLIWGFWRVRGLQAQLAASMGVAYKGNEWGFGQIMAVAVFVPTLAEMLFVGLRMRLNIGGVEEEQDELERQRPNVDVVDNLGSGEHKAWMGGRRRFGTAPT